VFKKSKTDRSIAFRGLFHLRKNVMFYGLLSIPLISFSFAFFYYTQGKPVLLSAVLVVFGFIGLILAVIIATRPDSGKLVRHSIASTILVTDSLVFLTQTDSPEQIVWFVTYPIYLFLITGFRNGLIYTFLLLSVFVFGYNFPLFLGHTPHIPYEIMVHAIIACIIAVVVVSYFQYRIEKYEKNMEKIAFYDHLTGAMSRHWMDTRLQEEIQALHRKQITQPDQLDENSLFSLILFDMDNFKKINDNYGHRLGDEALVKSIRSVVHHLRASDFVARWGGEEFLIFLRSTSLEGAVIVAEKIRKDIMRNQVYVDKIKISVTASFGVAQFQSDDTLESLVHRADSCMYIAKNTGKNKVVYNNQSV